jgi:hypothetical protein
MTSEASTPRDPSAGRRALFFARPIFCLAKTAKPLSDGYRWVPVAVLVGTVPFLLSALFQVPGHQWFSAVLLAWLCLPLLREDRCGVGVGTMALAFASHSLLVIAGSRFLPDWTEPILPTAAEYWAKQERWILTGEDPEYEWMAWIPAHLHLLAAATLWDFSSLGLLTFQHGFYEVDLMNYYNGRLLEKSDNPVWSLTLGWHVWSLLRGAGFLVLTFETCSLAMQFWTWTANSTPRRRAWRWSIGLGFLLCDAAAKAWLLESVRDQLFENWR